MKKILVNKIYRANLAAHALCGFVNGIVQTTDNKELKKLGRTVTKEYYSTHKALQAEMKKHGDII